MPVFEWNFNLGTIAALLFIAGGFYASVRMSMADMKKGLEKLTHVVTELAVQSKRLDNHGEHIASVAKNVSVLEDRVYKLSQGQGWIQQGLDGEYPKR